MKEFLAIGGCWRFEGAEMTLLRQVKVFVKTLVRMIGGTE